MNRTTAATNKRVNMTAHTSAGSAAGCSSWLVIGATPITGPYERRCGALAWAPSRIGVRSLCGPWASTPAQPGLHDAADHGSIGEHVVVVGALVAERINVLTGSTPVRHRSATAGAFERFISTALSRGSICTV